MVNLRQLCFQVFVEAFLRTLILQDFIIFCHVRLLGIKYLLSIRAFFRTVILREFNTAGL